jgi:CRP-like cAMP-binding protein
VTNITERGVVIGIFKLPRSEVVGKPFASHVPEDFWKILSQAGEVRSYKPGTTLYRSGARADGIYLVQTGEVSFRFASSKNRKKGLLQNAGPGSILALGEVMSGEPHKVTAETISAGEICLVSRPQLMEFLRTTPLACMQVVQLLSNDLHHLYETLRQHT